MLNRNDYRKYWVRQPNADSLCKGCDLYVKDKCMAGTSKEFTCVGYGDEGYVNKYAVFKLIKK